MPPFSYSISDTIYFFFHTATAKILDHRVLRLCVFYGAYQLRQQPAAVLYRFIHYIFAVHATTNSREMLHLAKENDLVLVYANSCSDKTIECSPFRRCIALIRKNLFTKDLITNVIR